MTTFYPFVKSRNLPYFKRDCDIERAIQIVAMFETVETCPTSKGIAILMGSINCRCARKKSRNLPYFKRDCDTIGRITMSILIKDV